MKDMVYFFCLVVIAAAGILYRLILDQAKTVRRHRALNSGARVKFTIDGRTYFTGTALRFSNGYACIREANTGLLKYTEDKNVTIL